MHIYTHRNVFYVIARQRLVVKHKYSPFSKRVINIYVYDILMFPLNIYSRNLGGQNTIYYIDICVYICVYLNTYIYVTARYFKYIF